MYRKKYLIGIYSPIEEGETLLGLCSNIREFSELLRISYDNAVQTLHLLFTKQIRCIRFSHKLCTVEFIDDTEDDL